MAPGENDEDSKMDETRKLAQEEAWLDLRSLIAKAKTGDASVVPRLREYFKQAPSLWQGNGDLALQSQAAWIKLIAGNNTYLQECIVAKVNEMKSLLADEDTPLLENLLVECVVSSWLQLYYQEFRQADEEPSLKWATFRMKQANAASDRHLKAVAALATMKKLIKDGSELKNESAAALPYEAPSGGAKDAGDTAALPHSGNRLSFHLKATQNSYHDVLDG